MKNCHFPLFFVKFRKYGPGPTSSFLAPWFGVAQTFSLENNICGDDDITDGKDEGFGRFTQKVVLTPASPSSLPPPQAPPSSQGGL